MTQTKEIEDKLSEAIKKEFQVRKLLNETTFELSSIAEERDILKKKEINFQDYKEKNKKAFTSFISFAIDFKLTNPKIRQKIVEITLYIAKKLNFSSEEIENIKIAASLSEISTLFFNQDEFNSDRQESDITKYTHVKSISFLENFSLIKESFIILKHLYETLDGKGVPDRLKKDEIPKESRIISIVRYFVFSLYEKGKSVEETFSEIEQECGILYDVRFLHYLQQYVADNLENSSFTQIDIIDLKEGMQLAESIYTFEGAKFLPKDTLIEKYHLKKIEEYIKKNILKREVFVNL